MAISAAHITVGTSAALLSVRNDQGGQTVAVYNPGPESVFLGGPDVTTGDGFELPAAADFSAELDGNDKLYAVAGTDQLVQVLRVGV